MTTLPETRATLPAVAMTEPAARQVAEVLGDNPEGKALRL